jgi:lipid-binding SYLF domain-containing protein
MMKTRAGISVLSLAIVTTAAVVSAASAKAPFDAKGMYVFAQNAQGVKLNGGTLVLYDVASTIYFKRDGQFGQVTNREFVKHWSAGESPYAVLLVGAEEIVVGLGSPKINGSDITYSATVLSGAANTSMGACTLFVDQTRTASASTASAGKEPINKRDREAREVIAKFKLKDSSLERFFKDAAGWAVFPTIAKGGFIVGGARGDGVVYEKDEVIGYSVVSQGTIGLQIGGQTYSEIVFFEDTAALNHFKVGNAELSAQASAVAVTAGASADAGYAQGVAIFTMAKGGAMLEASVGGQGFSFEEK